MNIAFNINIKTIDMRDFLQNRMQKKNSRFLLHQYDFYIFLHERFPFVPFLHSYVQKN